WGRWMRPLACPPVPTHLFPNRLRKKFDRNGTIYGITPGSNSGPHSECFPTRVAMSSHKLVLLDLLPIFDRFTLSVAPTNPVPTLTRIEFPALVMPHKPALKACFNMAEILHFRALDLIA